MAKLCMGTVQFGMKYGINNVLGQPSLEQSFNMLDLAIEKGINVIDTARAYGDAEKILGKYFLSRKNSDRVKIISKLRPNVIGGLSQNINKIIEEELKYSLKTIGVNHFDGYLLHTPEYVYREDIIEAMVQIRNKGLVDHIGVSIYDLKEGYEAIKIPEIDYIQLPYSILDQRGVQSEFITAAKKAGVTIYARSAFLQGLFMMPSESIPEYLKDAKMYLNIFESLIKKYNINKIDALIHFVTEEVGIDFLVFGVDTKAQLEEDVQSYKNGGIPKEFINEIKARFKEVDKSIIFPSLWSNGKKAE